MLLGIALLIFTIVTMWGLLDTGWKMLNSDEDVKIKRF